MEKIKVLLVSGEVTSEHDYPKMNEHLRTMLEATGRFVVKVIEEFNGITEKTVENYDMILLNYDGKTVPTAKYKRWNIEAEDVFFDFVKKGKGVYIHHSSVWLENEMPDKFKEMWGIYLTSPESRKCPVDDFFVEISKSTHPIINGLSDYMVVGDDFFAGVEICEKADVNILATVYDNILFYEKAGFPPKHHPVHIPDGKLENMRGVNTQQPVAWTNNYGNGRVFACSLGHDIDTYRRIDYLTLFVRACEWVATGEVTLDKPNRSGENRFNQWPYYKR